MSLVTVAITTYNSGKFILETLESISSQTYPDIELIVSDDASQDDTLEIVRRWIKNEGNLKRFSRVEILETLKNTGVSANANRALKASSGEWIKYIGADDTLIPDCIKENIQYISDNPEVKVLFSKVNMYRNTFEENNFLKTTPAVPISENSILWHKRTAESQYRMLILFDRIHFSPSAFLHRETLLSLGGFDERFRLLEDYPLWLNLTKNGYKLHFMDRTTVNYRKHPESIYYHNESNLIEPNFFKEEDFRKIYIYPNMPVDIRLNARFYWYISQIFRYGWLNRKTKGNWILLSLLTIYLNPFTYYIKLKKLLNKNLSANEFYN